MDEVRNVSWLVPKLGARPARRRLAVGYAADGEPIPAPRPPAGGTRCMSEPMRASRLPIKTAGSRRRATLAFRPLLARR